MNFNAFEEQKLHSISQLVVKSLWFPGQTEEFMTEFNCWTVQPLLPPNFQGLGLTWGGGLPVWDELLLLKDYFHKIFSIYALPVPTPIFTIISVEKELSQLFPTLLSAGSFALFPTLRVRPPELRGEVHCHGHDEGNPSDSSEEVQSAHNERQRPEQHPEEQWLVHAPHRKAASAGDGFYTQEKHRRGSGG